MYACRHIRTHFVEFRLHLRVRARDVIMLFLQHGVSGLCLFMRLRNDYMVLLQLLVLAVHRGGSLGGLSKNGVIEEHRK